MGMCPERSNYVTRIEKVVPGTNNFVTAVQMQGVQTNPTHRYQN